jgi:hypothetical protein
MLVSNARSTPFLVRLDFNIEPDIRPIAISSSLFYVSEDILAPPDYIAGGPQYRYLAINEKRAFRPFSTT